LITNGYKENWFKEWFGEEYIQVYSHRNEEEARRVVELIKKTLPLNKHSFILDAACGNGRHSCNLARFSRHVVGIDLSKALLVLAKEQCSHSQKPPFVQADIRFLPFGRSFDAALSLFTSFGYFLSDEENLKVLSEFWRVLKTGGVLFFDYLNKPHVIKNLKNRTEKTISGMRIIENRKIVRNRVDKQIIIEQNGKRRYFYESVRLYGLDELKMLMEKANFRIEKVLGDYLGSDYTEDSPRLIVIAKKK